MFLEKKFHGQRAFIDGDTYIVSKMANLIILTEAETVGHFNNIPNYDMKNLKQALQKQKYDLIFLKHNLNYYKDKEIQVIINEKYHVLNDFNMPKHLNKKILVPK